MTPLRVLELYSGIGGMHCGLTEGGVSAEVVAAVDVNTTANQVYKHNFPNTPLWPKSIEGISLEELDSLAFDMILMSPPCQPFTRIRGTLCPSLIGRGNLYDIIVAMATIMTSTSILCPSLNQKQYPVSFLSLRLLFPIRIGLQGDVSDPRAKSFLYILEILPRLQKPPRYILLENVKGFETSEARDALIRTLESCGYIYQEFLLSPPRLGIPNSRLRYFLIAKLQGEQFAFQTTNRILEEFPGCDTSEPAGPSSAVGRRETYRRMREVCATSNGQKEAFCTNWKLRSSWRENGVRTMTAPYRPCKTFWKTMWRPAATCCPQRLYSDMRSSWILSHQRVGDQRASRKGERVRRYGHYVEGTGSILQVATDVEISSAYKSLETLSDEEKLAKLSTLKLRYFTPREIANLHGFPAQFDFPDKITTKQRYRLLGNSLNVHVVAKLISLLLQNTM
ncbi:unnamed protein product [Ranitomeya imitator]|uniref:tRNA (cytosine(38)-C(5))-methyltransferase n=1 Tax=Ranitomeya imitator TaxID=111125 RepID=A0ABN9MFP0_9NEOB|nr:unnamed protein product [Ranitomeya imitator]